VKFAGKVARITRDSDSLNFIGQKVDSQGHGVTSSRGHEHPRIQCWWYSRTLIRELSKIMTFYGVKGEEIKVAEEL